MINPKIFQIFRRGSRTYFLSSLFFPADIRQDVFELYAFVRKADDFVDQMPQKKKEFHEFKRNYYKCLKTNTSSDVVIKRFVTLQKSKKFQQKWVDAFLGAMESDINKNSYNNLEELKKYTYGSAEAIGLMMAKIMNLPKKSYKAAQLQGRAMQFANFIRDIQIDTDLGRTYIPQKHLKKFGLKNLNEKTITNNSKKFESLIKYECDIYYKWQKKASLGYMDIPKKYRAAITTAADMYTWTIQEIERNPLIVLDKQIKPTKIRIIYKALKNSLHKSHAFILFLINFDHFGSSLSVI